MFGSHQPSLNRRTLFPREGNPYGARIEAPRAPWSAARVRVFSQRDQLTLDLPELLRKPLVSCFDAVLKRCSRSLSLPAGDIAQVAAPAAATSTATRGKLIIAVPGARRAMTCSTRAPPRNAVAQLACRPWPSAVPPCGK